MATVGLSIAMIFTESFALKSSSLNAQQSSLQDVGRAALNLLNWFQRLLTQVDTIADAEDRRRLSESLTLFNKAIYDLERDKHYLLMVLDRANPTRSEVQQAVNDTRESWRLLSNQLDSIGFEVRSLTGLDGPTVESRTRQAVESKGRALDEIDVLLREDRFGELLAANQGISRRRIIDNIKSAINDLNSSSIILFKIVEKLRENGESLSSE